jgi:two-component system chemotaxis sensor kinase CheA
VWFSGDTIALSDLGAVLAVGGAAGASNGPVVVLSTPIGRHAFRVDEIGGQSDVVVKPLGPLIPRSSVVSGAGVEPDGSVLLVLDAAGLMRAAVADAARPALEAPAPQRRRARILVVDDALTVRELERSILERAGYAVELADGASQALELLDAMEFDLVLTDIEMPGPDGFELTRAIRRNARTARLPVVVMSSREGDDDRRAGREAGVDGYLLKSEFDEHRLLTTVAVLLEAQP